MSTETEVVKNDETDELNDETEAEAEGPGDIVARLVPNDPGAPTRMACTLAQLRTYDRNPRQEPNPKFEEIKEAVLAMRDRGEPIQITITRRPDERDKPYMVHAGGNTFLEAVREVAEETGDPHFERIDCLFVPWRSEAEEIVAHLIENDVRGELVFIDRARSIMDLRAELERELGEELSQRRFTAILAEKGYRVGGQPALSRMEYAVETLLPHIPRALAAGLGNDRMTALRKFETAMVRYFEALQMDDQVEAGREVFLTALARSDMPEWTFERARYEIYRGLAQLTGEAPKMVQARIEEILADHSPEPRQAPEGRTMIDYERRERAREAAAKAKATKAAKAAAAAQEQEAAQGAQNGDPDAGPAGGGERDDRQTDFHASEGGADTAPPEDSDQGSFVAQEIDVGGVAHLGAKDLRARMWTLASQIAGRNGLDECVLLVGYGGGYVMDLPAVSLKEDAYDGERRAALWWFLGSLVDQWAMLDDLSCLEECIAAIPAESALAGVVSAYLSGDQALRTKAGETLESLVYTPGVTEMPAFCHRVLAELDDTDLKTFVALIDTRRVFSRMCLEQVKDYLWQL